MLTSYCNTTKDNPTVKVGALLQCYHPCILSTLPFVEKDDNWSLCFSPEKYFQFDVWLSHKVILSLLAMKKKKWLHHSNISSPFVFLNYFNFTHISYYFKKWLHIHKNVLVCLYAARQKGMMNITRNIWLNYLIE